MTATPDADSRGCIPTESNFQGVPRVPGTPERSDGSQRRRWEINLPYPRPPLTLNQRLHWAAKARLTRQIVDDVQILARATHLPTGLERVGIALHWRPSTRRRRDNDNITPTLKAAIDGLTRYGLTADDDSDHVTSGTVVESVGSRGRLWLAIYDMGPA